MSDVMKKVIEGIKWFFTNPRYVYCLGLVITIVATFLEMMRSHAYNYYDYQNATMMFWGGMDPYTVEFAETHSIFFLYPPVFCVLFLPIFILPNWLGPYVWNILHYSLFSLAVWTLPKPLVPYRMKMFLFLFSVLLQNVFFFQYNMVVCYIFLFAFTLLERNKPFWAVLLIMISATTKIYGVVELGLLFCYPKVWRNFGYAILCGIGLFLLPAVNPEFNLFDLYGDVRDNLFNHHSAVDYTGLLFARGLKPFLLPNYRIVQVVVLVVLGALFFWRHQRWQDFRFRVQALAIIMGYVILLSDSPETHTYLIALMGYLMAFWLQPRHSTFDWVIFWLLFVNFNILPTDVLCPPKVHNYIHETFWLDVYTMTVAWLQVIWWAMGPEQFKVQSSKIKVLLPLLLLLLPLGMQAQDKRYTVRGVSFVMKQVKGGTFMMGTDDPQAEADERPAHQVTVKDFYICDTEVTQALWKVIMDKNPAKNPGDNNPINRVSYDDCITFISRLNQLTGKHFRLPTEAEWEYAAKGGSDKRLSLQHLYDGVCEWCDSPYEEYVNPKSSWLVRFCRRQFRVIRGGSFQSTPFYTRITNRYGFPRWRRAQTVGMRLAM